ncbi:MAG TPA: UrcA family protein [Steroidobacteraceae bacterium]|nr:UrcA family protein [Steroidobacteraceae bacterium]
MSTFKSIHRASFWSAAFTSITCLLGATQAPAADPSGARSVTVSYRDLNLSSIEGATALYQRIKRAANHVCDEPGAGIAHFQEWKSCYQAAIADAVAKVNTPLLTAVSSGKSKESTATAMLNK